MVVRRSFRYLRGGAPKEVGTLRPRPSARPLNAWSDRGRPTSRKGKGVRDVITNSRVPAPPNELPSFRLPIHNMSFPSLLSLPLMNRTRRSGRSSALVGSREPSFALSVLSLEVLECKCKRGLSLARSSKRRFQEPLRRDVWRGACRGAESNIPRKVKVQEGGEGEV